MRDLQLSKWRNEKFVADTLYPLLQKVKEPLFLSEISSNSPLIKEIQSLLQEGGFYFGSINGVFDRQSSASFKAFKRKAFLEYPDVLGKSTADALLELGGHSKHISPKESGFISLKIAKGKAIKLLSGEVVYAEQPIFGAQHFTWGEATRNGSRIPLNSQIVQNIIELAGYLELVKSIFDSRPVIITSWYRPPEINRQQGGVKNSRHLVGDAVDFIVTGIPPVEVYRRLNNWHGSRGGLGNSSHFTHLDRRNYYARFSYG